MCHPWSSLRHRLRQMAQSLTRVDKMIPLFLWVELSHGHLKYLKSQRKFLELETFIQGPATNWFSIQKDMLTCDASDFTVPEITRAWKANTPVTAWGWERFASFCIFHRVLNSMGPITLQYHNHNSTTGTTVLHAMDSLEKLAGLPHVEGSCHEAAHTCLWLISLVAWWLVPYSSHQFSILSKRDSVPQESPSLETSVTQKVLKGNVWKSVLPYL